MKRTQRNSAVNPASVAAAAATTSMVTGRVAPSRALALAGQGDEGERRECEREGGTHDDREGDGDAGEPHDGRHDDGSGDRREGATCERCLAARRGHNPTHPRQERPQHPPDGEVPPGAAAADGVPRPGIRLEGPQQDDIDRAENDGADEAHGRRARDALGAPRSGPFSGKKGGGEARRQYNENEDTTPQPAGDRYEPQRGKERDDRYRRRDADLRTPHRDGAEVRSVRSRGCHSGRHGSFSPRRCGWGPAAEI